MLSLDELELLVHEYKSKSDIVATGYNDARDWIKEKMDRTLSVLELQRISAICNRMKVESLLPPENAVCNNDNTNISILMAFTDNYQVGYRCAHVNEKYAAKHNYEFNLRVLSYEDIMQQIAPRNNATYYKVKFINEKIEEILNNPTTSMTHYLVWIDAGTHSCLLTHAYSLTHSLMLTHSCLLTHADAMVIDPSIRLEELIHTFNHKDLIIAEDIHLGCPINAGVLLIKVSQWSRLLWKAVWDCHKYDTKTYYEQSALVHVLKKFGECLNLKYSEPLKSFSRSNPNDALYFPHVCVVPHHQLNSYYYNDSVKSNCEFIFHPYGMKGKSKLFNSIIEHFNIDVGVS